MHWMLPAENKGPTINKRETGYLQISAIHGVGRMYL